MSNTFSISDLHLFSLKRQGARLSILRASDHLLRRFGLLEIVDLSHDDPVEFNLRGEADEIWAPLSGRVDVTLVEQRSKAPARSERLQLTLDADEPAGLLIPFGVAYALRAEQPARLLRLSTHSEVHAQDRRLTPAELEGLPPTAPQ